MPLRLARRRTIAPGSSVYVSDTFQRSDRVDLGTADTGQTWGPAAGHIGILTLRAYANGGIGENTTYIDASHADCSVISVANSTDAAHADNGLLGRTNTVASSFFLWRFISSGAQLYRRTSGSYTQLASFSFSPGTTSHTMKLTLTGTSLTGFVDGVSRVSATDSQNQTVTTHGLRLGGVAVDVDFSSSFQVTG